MSFKMHFPTVLKGLATILVMLSLTVLMPAYAQICPTAADVTILDSGPFPICDGDPVEFNLQVAGDLTDVTIRWIGADGADALTGLTDSDQTYTANFSTANTLGCNETQQISWTVLCNALEIAGGNIDIEIFTEAQATVDESGACFASIDVPCPDDVQISYVLTPEGGTAGVPVNGSDIFGANASESGDVTFTVTPVAGTPMFCETPLVISNVSYSCDGDCPFGNNDSDEELCAGDDASLPAEATLTITDVTSAMVANSFAWFLVPQIGAVDPASDSPNSGMALAANNECDPTIYVFEGYVECLNAGSTSFEKVAEHTATVYPEIALGTNVTVTQVGCNTTISSNCDFTFVINGDNTPGHDAPSGSSGVIIPYQVSYKNSVGCTNSLVETFTTSCDIPCPFCTTDAGVCEYDIDEAFCDSDPIDDSWLPVLGMDFFVSFPPTGLGSSGIGFYLDVNGNDEYVPGSLTPLDNCTPSITEVFILIECDGATIPTGASFDISVFPDPEGQVVTTSGDKCCPTVVWECDGEPGWSIENTFDCSIPVDVGTFDVVISNDCNPAPPPITLIYNCSNCGDGENNLPEQNFCLLAGESDMLVVPGYGDLAIDDPSGTLDPLTFGWYDVGVNPNDGFIGDISNFTVSHDNTDPCAADGPFTLRGFVQCNDAGLTQWIEVASLSYTVYPQVVAPTVDQSIDALTGECTYTITPGCPSDILTPNSFATVQNPGGSDQIMFNVVSALSADCFMDFPVQSLDCPEVGCPTSTGFNGTEELCDGGDIVLFPILGTDFIVSDDFGTLINNSFAWHTSSTPSVATEFTTGTPVEHPGGPTACEAEDVQFFGYVKCAALGGTEEYTLVANHTVTVYPNPQAPTISRLDTDCNYSLVPACPDDVLSPNSFGPLPDETPGGTTMIDVSTGNAATPCASQVFQVEYNSCSACPLELNAPSAFTPNGDGSNDCFGVIGSDIESVEMLVFNRWGNEVYNSTTGLNACDSDCTTGGWNGRFNGVPAEIGVYVFYANVTILNAEPEFIQGNVVLFR